MVHLSLKLMQHSKAFCATFWQFGEKYPHEQLAAHDGSAPPHTEAETTAAETGRLLVAAAICIVHSGLCFITVHVDIP